VQILHKTRIVVRTKVQTLHKTRIVVRIKVQILHETRIVVRIKVQTEQGFKQGTEKIALNMLKNGESAEKVALYTGLSEEKVVNLQKRLMKNSDA